MSSRRARNADTGSNPPPSALPSMTPSGRTRSWLLASKAPVRPMHGLYLVAQQQIAVSFAYALSLGEIAQLLNDDAALALYRLLLEGCGVGRDRGLERRRVTVRRAFHARRERTESLAILWLGREAHHRDGAAVEIAFTGDDLRALRRHAFHRVRPLARRLERRFHGLRATVHRQCHVETAHLTEALQKRREAVGIKCTRHHGEPRRLLGERAHETRVTMHEAHCGIGVFFFVFSLALFVLVVGF